MVIGISEAYSSAIHGANGQEKLRVPNILAEGGPSFRFSKKEARLIVAHDTSKY
jgi:hypothetical protein